MWAPFYRAVGARIRAARTGQGLTLRQAAEKSGSIHHTYWGSVEGGERDPSLTTLIRIGKTLGIDADVPADDRRANHGVRPTAAAPVAKGVDQRKEDGTGAP